MNHRSKKRVIARVNRADNKVRQLESALFDAKEESRKAWSELERSGIAYRTGLGWQIELV